MTIAFRSSHGLQASSGSGPSVFLPSGITAGDLLVGVIGAKPPALTLLSGTWLSFGAEFTNHATSAVKMIGRVGEYVSGGSFTTSQSGGGSPSAHTTVCFSKGPSSSWNTAAIDADDTDVTGTTLVSTGGSVLDLQAGDYLLWMMVGHDDWTLSAETLTVPGCTMGPLTLATESTTTSLLSDLAMRIYYAEVLTGTASGAPSVTGTTSVSGVSGAAASFMRIREDGAAIPERRVGGVQVGTLVTGSSERRAATAALSTLVAPDARARRVSLVGLAVLVPSVIAEDASYAGWGVRL